MQRYWLSRGEDEVLGPYTVDELASMHSTGKLCPRPDLVPMVCAEGESVWQALSSVPALAWIMGGAAPAGVPALFPPSEVPGADPLEGQPITYSAAFDVGWRAFRSNYGLLLAATAITLAIAFGIGGALGFTEAIARQVGALPPVAITILFAGLSFAANILLNLPITVGTVWLAVRIARGERPRIDAIAAPFRRLLPVLGTALLLSASTLAAMIPGGLLLLWGIAAGFGRSGAAGGALGIGGIVLMMSAVVYITVRLCPAYMLAIDPQAGPDGPLEPVAAVSGAWRLTRGRTATLLGIGVVLVLILAGTILACILPWIFFGNPLYLAVLGAAYALLLRNRERAEAW